MELAFINEFIKDAEIENISIGCSGDKVSKITKKDGVFYLKESSRNGLDREYISLSWLDGKLNVPKIVMFQRTENKSYLLTKSLSGDMLCCDELWEQPDLVVKLAADAIKQLQQVDISACPMQFNLDNKLGIAKYNLDNGLVQFDPESPYLKRFGSLENVYNYLTKNKPTEEIVFSHGDASLPNIFVENNKISGFLDLGQAGCADKWFDIAIIVKSIRRNFDDEEKYVDKFFEYLGIEKNDFLIEYYILLVELFL